MLGDTSSMESVSSGDPFQGLGKNPMCDPFWSCLLQDYSDDEQEKKPKRRWATWKRDPEKSKQKKERRKSKKASSKNHEKVVSVDRYTSLSEL